MRTLLNTIYCKLRKEEIEKARTKFKMIKIDTILQSLTRLCWKYNIQYEVIIKTSDMLIIKMIGMQETVVFKYHKTDMVLKEDIDLFMNEIDENSACKGIYITTGKFQKIEGIQSKDITAARDCILEDGTAFIRRHIGIKGEARRSFKIDMLNFFKYLPQ